MHHSKMSWFICSLIALFLAFHAAMAMTVPPQHKKIKVACTRWITVDQSNRGNFKSIQEAVESVPLYNKDWICIYVNQGTYRERIYFTNGRSFIYLSGDGLAKTYVVSDGTTPFDETATLTTRTDNLIFEGISFINFYNRGTGNPIKQAAAGKIEGDKIAFYECGFYGLQDTLWDVSGRHYFKQCTIEGAIDFIFGSGQSIYEKCVISVVANALNGTQGYITAQGREQENESNGFVFKRCVITGNGRTFLGRPWRKYSRVVYYQTNMPNIIVPQGWSAGTDEQNLVTYAESECFGPGADTSQRPQWAKYKLNGDELKKFISISYINQEGWIRPDMITN